MGGGNPREWLPVPVKEGDLPPVSFNTFVPMYPLKYHFPLGKDVFGKTRGFHSYVRTSNHVDHESGERESVNHFGRDVEYNGQTFAPCACRVLKSAPSESVNGGYVVLEFFIFEEKSNSFKRHVMDINHLDDIQVKTGDVLAPGQLLAKGVHLITKPGDDGRPLNRRMLCVKLNREDENAEHDFMRLVGKRAASVQELQQLVAGKKKSKPAIAGQAR